MPGYKGHLAGGVVAYAVTLFILKNPQVTCVTAIGWLGATCAGALFPDIDIKSKGQKYFYWLLLFILLWSIWRFKALSSSSRFNVVASIAVISCLPMLIRHRGITHEPLFIVGSTSIGWFFISSLYPGYAQEFFFYALFFAIGALSHIWLDKGFMKKKRYNK